MGMKSMCVNPRCAQAFELELVSMLTGREVAKIEAGHRNPDSLGRFSIFARDYSQGHDLMKQIALFFFFKINVLQTIKIREGSESEGEEKDKSHHCC